MRLTNPEQLLNFFNTNGRRADLINALTVYMSILYEDFESGLYTWGAFPKSIGQFHFYERAIELSKGTFNKIDKYKFVKSMLDNNPNYKKLFYDLDKSNLEALETPDSKKFLKTVDSGIEDRSRHYTSTLLKLGFIYSNRFLTPAGRLFIDDSKEQRNEFENIIPIDKVNLVLLRQSLKIRVYNKDYTYYYSPAMLLMYLLTRHERLDVNSTFKLLNTLTPYHPVDISEIDNVVAVNRIEEFIKEYDNNFINIKLLENATMSREEFTKTFTNRKSGKDVDVYYEFYKTLYEFVQNPTHESFDQLSKIFEDEQKKKILNNNFGKGNNFLNFKVENFQEFINQNLESGFLNKESFNNNFYYLFKLSKRINNLKENKDTLKRLLRATGIFEIKNNIIKFAHRDIWIEYLKDVDFNKLVFNSDTSSDGKFYETNNDSPFFKIHNLNDIFNISENNMKNSLNSVMNIYKLSTLKQLKENMVNTNNESFKNFIKTNFPLEKTLKLLEMFSDRTNDKKIKGIVVSDAGIPTIYEYMIGIAWYHISNKEYDVFSSFNLTMNANFLPETHAGGGAGDIVVKYDDITLMLEVTLMNKNAQKRGEWEPVLRHATNLTIDEHPKKVRTLFIADELDENTINIWRAVASVPMKSTTGNDKYADNVIIMPFTTAEIITLMERKIDENKIFKLIDSSYSQLKSNFNSNWRNDIINNF
ncbi:AlwI family type II restriction endonuclease [Staphylococcus saprophyticus]|nr:AlwI family type II restriction endonuclease [Staphylococcus saprophyticus]